MSKSYFFTVFLVSAMLCYSCTNETSENSSEDDTIINNPTYGTWQDRTESPVNLEFEQEFGSEPEEQGVVFSSASRIIGPVADHAGNIYILDSGTSKLRSFTENGNLRWETGSQGKGPGAFSGPDGMATDGTFLYLDNIDGSRIDKYDMEGNFIRSYTWDDSNLRSLEVEGMLPNGHLVTSSTLWGSLGTQVNILELSKKLSVVSQFDINVAENIDLGEGLSSGIGISIVDSLITAGNNVDYRIPFYDENGERVNEIQRSFDKMVRPGFYNSGGGSGIMDFGGLRPPVKLGSDYLLVALSWPTNVDDPDQFAKTGDYRDIKSAHSVDLFDETGTLLYSMEGDGSEIPDFGKISYVDPNGKVYIKTNEPYPQVRRYSLTIKQKP